MNQPNIPLPVGPFGPVDIEFTREDIIRALAGTDFDVVQIEQDDGTFRTVADLFKDLAAPTTKEDK